MNSKNVYWRQIRLMSEDNRILVTWAEEQFCKVGKLVTLDDDDNKRVYKVTEVYSHRKTNEQVMSDKNDYKRTHIVSDL